MSDYEPPAEMVEALEREICGVYAMTASGSRWTALTRFVLRRQHEREERLLSALRYYANNAGNRADCALAAHAKLDAPKVPTLLEAARNAIEDCGDPDGRAFHGMVVTVGAWQALKAAVEREEKR